jgi:hypothetical protein
MNVIAADVQLKATAEDMEFVLPLADQVDVVVMTNHYYRGEYANWELIRKLLEKKVKLVTVTNNPYEPDNQPGVKTAVCTFANTPESMRVAAGILFGKGKAQGKWPLVNYRR